MHIANNEHKFYVKVKGDRTGESFEGDFIVKCILNIQEQVEVAIRVDRYNNHSRTIDPGRALLNRCIAELELRVVKAPTWWVDSDSGRTLADENVLYEVFQQAMEGEVKWADRIKKAADGAEDEQKKTESEKVEKNV